MKAKLICALVMTCALTGCSAGAKVPDLTPSGAFDPVKDRDRVLYCINAHLNSAPIAIENLHMDEARVRVIDEKTISPRHQRLKPFAEYIEAHGGKGERGVYSDAGYSYHRFNDQFTLRALIPGQADKIWNDMLAESAKCDALVRSWGAPPPN